MHESSRIPSALRRSLLFLLAVLCSVQPASAQEKKSVVWPYFSFPPYTIVEPDGTLSGASVRLQAMFAHALPGYRHERINSPVNRTMLAVREGGRYCLIGLLKRPDRERSLRYSTLPCRLVPPQVAVAERGVLDGHKNAEGRVSLRELLQDGRLANGHIKGFSHGPVLDAILEAESWRENVFEIVDMKSLGRQLELLLSGRIQYFITTPDQAWYALREQGLGERLEMVRVAEATDWNYGYVACENGEWSGEVMERIDEALARGLQNGEIRAIYKNILPPQLWPEYDAAWERLMLPLVSNSSTSD